MVENLLDLGNASAVLNAVLTGSGLKLRDSFPGEAAAPGAGPGAGSTTAGLPSDLVREVPTAGDISMASSLPPAATATP